jgi:site-specific DNA-methyltransferase (adenine-specific)
MKFEEMINQVIQGDCLEVMKDIPDKSIDCVIFDPPYGILGDHKIETKIDIERLFKEIYRITKKGSFISYFGMMPTLIDWENQCRKIFRYKNHISWIKRNISNPFSELYKVHEEIMIYTKDIAQKYYETKGKYTDIKVEGIYFDINTIESLKRVVLEMEQKMKGKFIEHHIISNKNDDIYKSFHGVNKGRYQEYMNFTNVWSFLPENRTNYNKYNIKHPTVKPAKLLRRLVQLTSKKDDLILDCFAGSGTTGRACKDLGRRFILIEKEPDYVEICKTRLAQEVLF